VIEHTNRVIFLEDDDVAAVVDGRLSIHRIKRTAGDHPGRAVQTLQMELQQIMKGEYLVMLGLGMLQERKPLLPLWLMKLWSLPHDEWMVNLERDDSRETACWS
jgi:hypothetical protein